MKSVSAFIEEWKVPLVFACALGVLLWTTPVLGEIKCGEAIEISGFSKLLGTVWGYLSGPVGKVMAIGLIVFGAGSVIARNYGVGVAALIGAFVIAFSSDIVRTLFEKAGAAQGC